MGLLSPLRARPVDVNSQYRYGKNPYYYPTLRITRASWPSSDVPDGAESFNHPILPFRAVCVLPIRDRERADYVEATSEFGRGPKTYVAVWARAPCCIARTYAGTRPIRTGCAIGPSCYSTTGNRSGARID